MARVKIAYLGGGSSRAPGTMASFMHHGSEFDGSEFVLIDLDPDHLEVVRSITQRMARNAGLDITVTTTTDQREGLRDVDAVLSSFRPGGFAARAIDERIPLKYGVIGQETQGPGGMMMALRSVQVIKELCANLAEVAPRARIFNYTNPVNIVSQAVSDYTDIPIASFCEGPIVFPPVVAKAAGLDPDKLKANLVGINHNCWSNEATYDGQDAFPILRERYEALKDKPTDDVNGMRALHLAVAMESVPSDYFNYYYFRDEILRERQLAAKTRSEVIMDALPDYWQHYREQAASDAPRLEQDRSRGGIHELELAIDAISAYYNDTAIRLPFNITNTGGWLPGFADSTVVELWGSVDGKGFHPEQQKPLPHSVLGITQQLAEYQILTAKAAWEGNADDAVRALMANPLVPSLTVAEAMYAELAAAQSAWLPERLLP
ncbi:6-phospho-beta-glucosidase [Actinacidiphila yanglinensis]|uniref:6-phospho-beta-glucosidase n=1 Tax=Actinacidiphila yanglinensis TaxID=310779 RepID=A0A1H6DG32_9ACTN|nr:glycoside hydrolase [Actinacidiphila yanglinensis]SEG84219.1 6-phospho-beta-glucosidase [Actinacidiphila yanglinensis]